MQDHCLLILQNFVIIHYRCKWKSECCCNKNWPSSTIVTIQYYCNDGFVLRGVSSRECSPSYVLKSGKILYTIHFTVSEATQNEFLWRPLNFKRGHASPPHLFSAMHHYIYRNDLLF